MSLIIVHYLARSNDCCQLSFIFDFCFLIVPDRVFGRKDPPPLRGRSESISSPLHRLLNETPPDVSPESLHVHQAAPTSHKTQLLLLPAAHILREKPLRNQHRLDGVQRLRQLGDPRRLRRGVPQNGGIPEQTPGQKLHKLSDSGQAKQMRADGYGALILG